MTAVAPALSTVVQIRQKIRRLTATASNASLTDAQIDQAINTFYSQDFPYAIKLDQMRDVYTFYTEPNRDRYPLDVQYNQGVRDPIYFDGIQGYFYKDRNEFFKMWPRWPSTFHPASGNGSQQSFTFTIPGPFLSEMVTIGCVDTSGDPISIRDDGNGTLLYSVPNSVIPDPPFTPPPAIPGMHNLNLGNPGLQQLTAIGTVDYVTGNIFFDLALVGVTPAAGQVFHARVSQYATGRPYCLLFWNNEFTIRPIPKFIHKVEVETYLTPVQFLSTTDNPIILQWWQYIAYGASLEILRERQDMDGVENLMEGFQRQEGLVLERQGVEEIGQRNTTVFAGNNQAQGWNNPFLMGWY